MRRYLKLYFIMSTHSIKTVLQHKKSIWFFMIGKIIRFAMFFVFVFGLLKSTKFLAGFTLNETLVFYLTFNVIDTFTQMVFREVYRFRYLVTSGELDGVLVKPYHPFLKVLMGGMDIMDLFILVPYIGLLIYFIFRLQDLTTMSLIIYFLLFINAFIIATAFHILVLALGILTTEVDHAMMIYRDLSKMAMVPVDIYKEPIRSLITFVLPIGIMITYPVKGLLNMLNWELLTISFVFGGLS